MTSQEDQVPDSNEILNNSIQKLKEVFEKHPELINIIADGLSLSEVLSNPAAVGDQMHDKLQELRLKIQEWHISMLEDRVEDLNARLEECEERECETEEDRQDDEVDEEEEAYGAATFGYIP
jgi:hypothetical protein